MLTLFLVLRNSIRKHYGFFVLEEIACFLSKDLSPFRCFFKYVAKYLFDILFVLKAEQLRQQFSRSETEKTELSRKLEEAQAKLEDNESTRKRLQNRLEGLNRQMEEGQGDRDRLVEQLESLRGQVWRRLN